MLRRMLPVACLACLCVVAPAAADPRDDLIAAFGKAMESGRYSATIATGGRNATEMRMRVILPNRFHMKTPETEMIILPQGTWMNANGQWMQFPMNMSKMIEGYSETAVEEGIAALKDVRVVGNETIEGCDSTVYAYSSSGKFMGVDANSQAEAAICGSTGLPIRVISRDRKGNTEATITYDYATEFDIRPPN